MKASPTTKNERIVALDVIRGIALFGILLANIASFKSPVFHLQNLPSALASVPLGMLNQWTVFFIDLFIVGKFYPMFSFLFGLGFYLFFERLRKKDFPAGKMYRQRLVFLLGIGFIHLVFVWTGDILHTYAIAGFLLLWFVDRKPKNILIWGCSLIILSSIILGFLFSMSYLFVSLQEGSAFEEEALHIVNTAQTIYSSGSYMDILQFRLEYELQPVWFNLLLNVPHILGLFLIGVYVGKRGFISQAVKHAGFWRKVQLYSLVSGGSLSVVYAFLKNGILPLSPWLSSGLAEGLNIQAGPLLMMFYVSSIVLWTQRNNIHPFFHAAALVGRMALTNYILQSILCVIIFYGFGFQLYGQVGAFTGIIIAVILCVVQILLSWWWLKNFERGPLETIWRKWTYR